MYHRVHRRDLTRVTPALIASATLTLASLTGCAADAWVSPAGGAAQSGPQATEAAQAAGATAAAELFLTGAADAPVTAVLVATEMAVGGTASPQPTAPLQATLPTPAATSPAESPATPAPAPTLTQPAPPGVAPAGDAPLACDAAKVDYGMVYIVCVTGITVNDRGHLVVQVTWSFGAIPRRATVIKKSDQGNRNMYLTDDLGNRYDHLAGGGAAYSRVTMADGVPQPGWFEFPAPALGATAFRLHDDDQGLVLNGVALSAPAGP